MPKKVIRYHNQKGVHRQKAKWPWLFTLLPVLGIAAGLYLLINTTSPMIPNPTGRVEAIVKEDRPSDENRLYIPKIGIDIPFYTGNEAVLDKGAWHRFPERGDPEKGGNFILSAHRFRMGWTPEETRKQSPFYYINELDKGDILFVDYNKKRYKYTIEEKFQVKPTQIEIEEPSQEAKMTLYACTLLGSDDGREVFIAKPTQ